MLRNTEAMKDSIRTIKHVIAQLSTIYTKSLNQYLYTNVCNKKIYNDCFPITRNTPNKDCKYLEISNTNTAILKAKRLSSKEKATNESIRILAKKMNNKAKTLRINNNIQPLNL